MSPAYYDCDEDRIRDERLEYLEASARRAVRAGAPLVMSTARRRQWLEDALCAAQDDAWTTDDAETWWQYAEDELDALRAQAEDAYLDARNEGALR